MEVLTEAILNVITPRPAESHKGTYGRAVLVGGDSQYGGAIMMAAQACVAAGAGLTTVITHPQNHTALHSRLPEAMVVDWFDEIAMEAVLKTATIVLIGSGLGTSPHSRNLLHFVLERSQHVVIDGSAITLIAEKPEAYTWAPNTIFTPHQMEWQRLSGLPIEQQTPANNQAAQQRLQATIVLKSHRTEIYRDNTVLQNPLGTPAMATGGTGDTLAGIIAGFLAQFHGSRALPAAVYTHSAIAEGLAQTHYVVLPTTIATALPVFMKQHEVAERSVD